VPTFFDLFIILLEFMMFAIFHKIDISQSDFNYSIKQTGHQNK